MEKTSRIRRGRVEMDALCVKPSMTYISPAVGPNSYQEVGKQIIAAGLMVPVGDYTAPLVRDAYCDASVNEEPEFVNIREVMRNRWLWVFNRNLWTDKGMFSMHDPKAIGRSKPFNLRSLERKLKGGKEVKDIRFSEDGTVRFAPKGSYTLGEIDAERLAQDGVMIARYGIEGAKLMAEAASTLRNKPITYGLDIAEDQNPELRVSTLHEGDSRLHFIGGNFYDYSFAFPVRAPHR